MTDRVNVNHATIERIEQRWNKKLNELNCNLHPLDTIASSCRAALNKLETDRGALLVVIVWLLILLSKSTRCGIRLVKVILKDLLFS